MSASDEGEDGSERRRFPRTALSILVQYRFNSFEDFLAEYSVNISTGGMYIKTARPMAEGSMIYLQFSLQDGSRLIEGMGRVVRCVAPGKPGVESGMGVEFVNFDDESMALVEEICAARQKSRN